MKTAQELFNAIKKCEFEDVRTDALALLKKVLESLNQNLQNGVRPTVQIHPLGFLCIRWILASGNTLRIHIWDKSFQCVQTPNWPIHDHIFSFTSYVLEGEVQNKTYMENDQPNRRAWLIYTVDYFANRSELKWFGQKLKLKVKESSIQRKSSNYRVVAGVFHRTILRSDFAITVLATDQTEENLTPRVIGTHETRKLHASKWAN